MIILKLYIPLNLYVLQVFLNDVNELQLHKYRKICLEFPDLLANGWKVVLNSLIVKH